MSVPYLLFAYKSLPSGMDSRIKKEPLPTPKTGIDRGSWFVFRAFKQVPKSTLISALKMKPRGTVKNYAQINLQALTE